MLSGISYGIQKPLNIVAGKLVKRAYNSVRRTLILENIIRILQENQTDELAYQTTLDGWSSNPLNVIPTSRWHVGTGKDFNDLAVNLAYTSNNIYKNGVKYVELLITLIVTVEKATDVYEVYKRADSYNTCFEAILDTYFLYAEPELRFNTNYDALAPTPSNPQFFNFGIEEKEVIKTGLVNTGDLRGVEKSIGFLPTLQIRIVYQLGSKENLTHL